MSLALTLEIELYSAYQRILAAAHELEMVAKAELDEIDREPPEPPVEFLEFIRRRAVTRTSVEPYCESPIEQDMAIMLIETLGSIEEFKFAFCPYGEERLFLDCDALITPQYPWQGYRIDFAIRIKPKRYIFIECDGKHFHSSDAQIARDRRKDKAAELAGILMLRFSGSHIFRDICDEDRPARRHGCSVQEYLSNAVLGVLGRSRAKRIPAWVPSAYQENDDE